MYQKLVHPAVFCWMNSVSIAWQQRILARSMYLSVNRQQMIGSITFPASDLNLHCFNSII